jgi:hypothetical protein
MPGVIALAGLLGYSNDDGTSSPVAWTQGQIMATVTWQQAAEGVCSSVTIRSSETIPGSSDSAIIGLFGNYPAAATSAETANSFALIALRCGAFGTGQRQTDAERASASPLDHSPCTQNPAATRRQHASAGTPDARSAAAKFSLFSPAP